MTLSAAELYLAVSERFLRLRTEREVPEDEEADWAAILDTLWDDLDEAGCAAVEEGLRTRARQKLADAGLAKQKEFK